MKKNPYQTILVIVTGFLLLGYLLPLVATYFYLGALIIGALSLISETPRDWIIDGWEMLSHALGWFNSKVLLSIVFIFFLTPIAFLYRLMKKDLLMINTPPESSAYIDRNHTFGPGDLENPW